MKTFNNIEEMKEFYTKKTNEFYIDDDIELTFDLNCNWNIKARNIDAMNITAIDIYANNINAWNISACDIRSWDITSWDIKADNIKAWKINAKDIEARDINALGIKAMNIDARDINTCCIKAVNINFYAVCFAYETFKCKSIKSKKEKSKYFCLDGDVEIIGG